MTNDTAFGFMGVSLIVGVVGGVALTMATTETKHVCIENYASGWVGSQLQWELDDNDKTDAEKRWHNMIVGDVIPQGGSVIVSPTGRQLYVPDNCFPIIEGNRVTLWSKE